MAVVLLELICHGILYHSKHCIGHIRMSSCGYEGKHNTLVNQDFEQKAISHLQVITTILS